MTNFHWYVVYTRPRSELKVANLLARKNIKNYCPLQINGSHSQDARKMVPQPLFTSFVFVYIQEAEMVVVQSTPGVLNFLYWLNKPVQVDEDEINALVKLSKTYDNLKLEKCIIRPNRTAETASYECVTPEQPESDENVKIVLPSIGYYVVASSTLS